MQIFFIGYNFCIRYFSIESQIAWKIVGLSFGAVNSIFTLLLEFNFLYFYCLFLPLATIAVLLKFFFCTTLNRMFTFLIRTSILIDFFIGIIFYGTRNKSHITYPACFSYLFSNFFISWAWNIVHKINYYFHCSKPLFASWGSLQGVLLNLTIVNYNTSQYFFSTDLVHFVFSVTLESFVCSWTV